MDATMSDMEPGLGQMIGLRSLWAAIRRNRRVWLVTGLLGLIVGASLPLVLPHKSLAVTDLYLAQTAGAIRRKQWLTTCRSWRQMRLPRKRSMPATWM